MSFANLKNNKNSIDSLRTIISSMNATESYTDDRYWEPTVDKVGNGMALIRFLPAPECGGDDALPWVKVYSHSFQGVGGWYIDLCPTTLATGADCPVCAYNSKLWNSGVEANQNIARKQKRRLNYISNIYVISDPAKPENNGKVFLYKYGKKIFDKLSEAINPPFEDEKSFDPFDLWTGANFKLRIRNVEDYRNYDKSEFGKNEPLLENDAELERIWRSEHSLLDIIAPNKFKSPEKMAERLNRVVGNTATKSTSVAPNRPMATNKPQFVKPTEPTIDDDPPFNIDDDAEFGYFQSLVDE